MTQSSRTRRASHDKHMTHNAKLTTHNEQRRTKNEKRLERDTMGEMEVPAEAYYGANTRRAELNFPISDLRFPRRFIQALGLIKAAAAEVNLELGHLDRRRGEAIVRAAREVADGSLDAVSRSWGTLISSSPSPVWTRRGRTPLRDPRSAGRSWVVVKISRKPSNSPRKGRSIPTITR
jgi:hypothetical protein